MNLRYYQQEAVNAVLQSLATSRENVAVEIPTGGGKTPIIATLCKTFAHNGYRTLVLAHRAELLSQTVDKLRV
jgi:DNA repair protein RadD